MVPKWLIITIVFAATIFIVYQIAINKKCEHNKEVVIRYIPKTMEEEALYGQTETEIFRTMFSQPSPWVKLMSSYDRERGEDMKNYFVSQS